MYINEKHVYNSTQKLYFFNLEYVNLGLDSIDF